MRTRLATTLAATTVAVLAMIGAILAVPTASAAPSARAGALTSAVDSADAGAKIEHRLSAELADQRSDFLIRFSDQADLTQASQIADWDQRGAAVAAALRRQAELSQADTLAMLRARGVEAESFWATNAILVHDGSQQLAQTVAALPEVARLYQPRAYSEPDPIEPTAPAPKSADPAVEWGIADIKADQVWRQYDDHGEGMVVASIDSGVQYDHPALVKQYRGNNGDGTFSNDYNWMDVTGDCSAPCDDNGHGTHTMGTMVGNDAGGTGIGVAPGAKWIAVNGCCPSDTALIAAGQWILAPTDHNGEHPDASMRPDVVNNSWGSQTPSNDPFMEDIEKAWAASGIFSSFANGNNGPGCQTSGAPGSRSVNYSVGAYDAAHQIGSFSSRGPGQDGEVKPSIAAPGVSIRSSVPGSGYDIYDGTSMAAPHLAGAVALLWSAAPVLVGDVDATRRLLDESAIDTPDLTCGGTAGDNNVWGQGRLDVAALLAHAPLGEAGFVAGTVTSSTTGKPVADATVSASGPFDTSRVTGADGTFRMALPVGSYDISVSGFGYRTDQASGLAVTVDHTTTHDVALQDADLATVHGTVTDGSGHGWPLYARVDVPGTPVSTFTDPVTGDYSVDLPVGTSYDVRARPVDAGYRQTTDTVTPGASSDAVDLVSAVDPDRCRDALGYHLYQPRIAMVTNLPDQFRPWFTDRQLAVDMFTPSQLGSVTGYDVVIWGYSYTDPGKAAFTDFLARTDTAGTGVVFLDDRYATTGGIALLSKYTGAPTSTGAAETGGGETAYYEASAAHPVLQGIDVGQRWEHEPGLPGWMKWFSGYDGDGRQVLANIGSTAAGTRGAGIAVQQRANNRHVLLSMHSQYYTRGPDGWSATSERVFENALAWANADDQDVACRPEPGGLVIGRVSDLNTGDGVAGARVVSGSARLLSVATDDDPDQDDGLARFFEPAGTHDVTATLADYRPAQASVTVADDRIATVDLPMAAGRLALSTSTVDATVAKAGHLERTVTIENTGSAPATVELAERDRGSDIAMPSGYGDAAASSMVDLGTPSRTRAAVTPLRDVLPDKTSVAPQVSPAADAAESWQAGDAMPAGVVDNLAAVLGSRLYSFGGTTGAGPMATAWVHDPTGGWQPIADLPQPRQAAAGAFVAGRFVMLGGWTSNGSPSQRTLSYDPDTDTWTRDADHPAPMAASGSAVLDGRIYTVGGCASSCDSTTVYAYDVAADSFERVADYPIAAGWLNCGAIRTKVYCAGGYSGSGGTKAAYSYDPQADAWTKIASMPADAWGSSATTQGGRLLVTGGVSGPAITSAGWAYEPRTDSWSALPNAPQPTYRAGAACGFYTLGGSPNGSSTSNRVTQLTGQGDCLDAASDAPWLGLDPVQLTLAPGESTEVTMELDGTAAAQPGELRANVQVHENTPYPVSGIAVTMTVPPPADWGAVVGQVSGRACDGTTAPLAGATIQVDATGVRWTGITGVTGSYVRWVDTANNPVRVSALATGWSAASSQVKVGRKPKEVDLTLRRSGC